MKNYNALEFQAYFDQFAGQLEKHRQKCKFIFLFCTSIAALLLILLPWYVVDLAEFFNQKMAGMAGEDWKAHASVSDVVALSLVIAAISVALVLWPLFSYRGKNKSAGMIPRDYSLKDYAYSHLLKYFGDFQFAPEGGMLGLDLENATIIPDSQVHLAEDYIKGVINDCTVKVAETKIVQLHGGKRIAVFNGLMMIVDICDIKVKLTGNFAGRTVLIADTQKELKRIREKYAKLEQFPLPAGNYEEQFEAYTNNPDEARQLLQSALLDILLNLQTKLQNLSEQIEHWDSKIAHATHSFIERLPVFKNSKLAAEVEYDRKYSEDSDFTKEDIISLDVKAINHHVQAEFFNDKLVITVPCRHDLFEPNSLFEPALNKEDGEVLFALMQSLEIITQNIKFYLANRQ